MFLNEEHIHNKYNVRQQREERRGVSVSLCCLTTILFLFLLLAALQPHNTIVEMCHVAYFALKQFNVLKIFESDFAFGSFAYYIMSHLHYSCMTLWEAGVGWGRCSVA